jgi:hypothetical protein
MQIISCKHKDGEIKASLQIEVNSSGCLYLIVKTEGCRSSYLIDSHYIAAEKQSGFTSLGKTNGLIYFLDKDGFISVDANQIKSSVDKFKTKIQEVLKPTLDGVLDRTTLIHKMIAKIAEYNNNICKRLTQDQINNEIKKHNKCNKKILAALTSLDTGKISHQQFYEKLFQIEKEAQTDTSWKTVLQNNTEEAQTDTSWTTVVQNNTSTTTSLTH